VTISLIMAADRTGLIGNEGKLPWHLPRDLKRFRELTWGKPIIMGRRTFESLGRPLPGRRNIVLSRRQDYHASGVDVVSTLAEAIHLATNQLPADPAPEVMIIGGSEVFLEAVQLAQRAYLTLVEGTFPGDVRFPLEVLESAEWQLADEESWPADEKNRHAMQFVRYERRPGP